MLAAGRIRQLGVLPPEIGVPVDPFLREIEKREMKGRISRTHILAD